MDFDAAEHHALTALLHHENVFEPEAAAQVYAQINKAAWAALERREITMPELKHLRFARFLEAIHRTDIDPDAMGHAYEEELSKCGFLLPGAEDFLRRVSAKMPVALVTNGISFIQRGRLRASPLPPYLSAIIISEEYHLSKPDPRLAEVALEALGCADRREAVFLGDSLTADIACAAAAGLDSIWLTPSHQTSPLPTHTVHTLEEAERVLG